VTQAQGAKGRPLRFLAAVLGGWTAIRIAMLWPEAAVHAPSSVASVASAKPPLAVASANAGGYALPVPDGNPPDRSGGEGRTMPIATHEPQGALPAMTQAREAAPPLPPPPAPVLATAPSLEAAHAPSASEIRPASQGAPSRWSGSVWLFARPAGAGNASLLSGPELGGGQAGLRLAYALDQGRRLAVMGRMASALNGTGREAAIGLEWRPARLLRLIAERRVALDGGAGATALGVVGGAGPISVGPLTLESYGQAGLIERGNVTGYVDGLVRIERPVAQLGKARFGLGVGMWGGAQARAGRLDLGPAGSVRLPLAGRPVRLSAEWRERVAGNAAPGSGFALTLGTDF